MITKADSILKSLIRDKANLTNSQYYFILGGGSIGSFALAVILRNHPFVAIFLGANACLMFYMGAYK